MSSALTEFKVMDREQILTRLRSLKPWLSEQGVTSLRLFGSVARDEAGAGSDVDLAASFQQTPSLLELIGLEQALAEKLGMPVDLATMAGLKPSVRDRVERDGVNV
jgi:predicted nucleotidyltransferase